jgi:hypothetical protein
MRFIEENNTAKSLTKRNSFLFGFFSRSDLTIIFFLNENKQKNLLVRNKKTIRDLFFVQKSKIKPNRSYSDLQLLLDDK